MSSTRFDRARERWQKICEDWAASGLSPKSYCKERNIPASNFFKWREKIDFPIPIKPEKITYNWEEISKDLHASGLSIHRYCKEKGIPPRDLYRWEKENNNPTRILKSNRWRESIKNWEASGLTTHEYCKLNGLALSTFEWWKRRLNLQKIRRTSHVKTVEKWTKIMGDWQESGLSKFTFCQRNGISSPSFYIWVKKLNLWESRQSGPDFTRKAPDICLEDHFTSIPFGSGILMGSPPANKTIELILPQGHQLRIEGQCDWEGLNAWIALLLQQKNSQ